MGYFYLCSAIILEIIGTTCMKYSDGFSKLGFSAGCLATYALCFYCLSKTMLTVPLSVTYATWCALGIVLSTAVAIFVFGERLTAAGITGIIFIIVGVTLVNLFGINH